MIEVVKAKKYYNRFKRNRVTAIDNTTLSFGDSGLVAILGNSGSGKTTLLNMIGGLDRPDSGKIFVNGKRMNGLFSGHTDNIRNKNIGYIFQNYHLVDDMTVFDNVALPLRMLGVRKKDKLRENVNYALEKVGLYRYRNRPATALSGGERQRVGIARAIVKNPGIIIADEPTGNLDSGNSLEVMNIIKTISKEKLVILVTHERDLAEFYADRIIEIVDGKVVNDYVNERDEALDYRIDNHIYLKDFETHESGNAGGLNLSFYSDNSTNLDVTLVLRNGNLYIQTNGKKTEVVDDDSAIEFIDDHYHALSKEEAEKNNFDYSKLDTGLKRLRYHSIYNIFSLFVNGVKKILNYPILKKLLLLGFVASSMFIMYSASSVLGINTVTDDEFIQENKYNLRVSTNKNTVEEFIETENLESVRYVMPGTGKVSLTFDYSNYYYQTSNASDNISASLAGTSLIDETMLVAGRMPENEYEMVIDKLVFKSNNTFDYGNAVMVGLKDAEDFIGKECAMGQNPKKFTIVGVVDQLSPSVYAPDEYLFDIIMRSGLEGGNYGDENNTANVSPISESKGLEIVYGRMPTGLYEVILPEDYVYSYWLEWRYPGTINGKSLWVVGFYRSSKDSAVFVSDECYRYKYISTTSNMTLVPEDKDAVMMHFQEHGKEITDTFDVAERDYKAGIKDEVKRTMIIAAIVLAISLVEIFLMLRSSFLSRVKEVGTLRAIGLKKSDVYKMFLGEILVITFISSTLGFAVMGYVLHSLTQYAFFANQYVFDERVILISVAIVYVSNILFGLLPVFFTMRKTPAKILSRTDVD
ncbi:MAG: ABC transporter ATP-binding protein/permease [Firmicutes bacterium]|nr:ABC transporter ATP-binding protein/permease [Bacillota bacterium]